MKENIRNRKIMNCCRCDKEIKNQETNCYCQECVLELYNKYKSKTKKLREEEK